MGKGGGYEIVLTADRATMTDYGGADVLGFVLCVPYRLIPKYLLANVFAPPIKTDDELRAEVAPYALRKLEAALYASGFSDEEVVLTTPEKLKDAVGPETVVLALHVLDPLGLAPVSYTLSSLMGGGSSCTKLLFFNTMKLVTELKRRYGFKLVVGGPGTWQIEFVRAKLDVDCVVHGEGELIFPSLCNMAIKGLDLPATIDGGSVPVERIPAIIRPSRNGIVQITRGCPRRCQFCNPTMFDFRSIPLDVVRAEAEVNVRAGFSYIGLITEDGLLYGARGVKVNERAVLALAKTLRDLGVRAGFCHLSVASVVQGERVLSEWAHIFDYSRREPEFPQVGLETGSPRLIKRYMAGKPRPWKPEDWPWLVQEATHILNENGLFPCYTMILGLPGEREEDVRATLELVEDMHGLDCWLFPLLFVPMGRSLLEKERFAMLKKSFGQIHWELVVKCIEHDIAFSRRVLKHLTKMVKNALVRRMATDFLEIGMRVVESVENRLLADPLRLLKEASRLNVFNAGPGIFFSLIKGLFHAKMALARL